jgi:hypothetical protein
MTNAGLILLTSFNDLDEHELSILKSLNRPSKTIVVNVGELVFGKELIDRFIPSDANLEAAVSEIASFIAVTTESDPEFAI